MQNLELDNCQSCKQNLCSAWISSKSPVNLHKSSTHSWESNWASSMNFSIFARSYKSSSFEFARFNRFQEAQCNSALHRLANGSNCNLRPAKIHFHPKAQNKLHKFWIHCPSKVALLQPKPSLCPSHKKLYCNFDPRIECTLCTLARHSHFFASLIAFRLLQFPSRKRANWIERKKENFARPAMNNLKVRVIKQQWGIIKHQASRHQSDPPSNLLQYSLRYSAIFQQFFASKSNKRKKKWAVAFLDIFVLSRERPRCEAAKRVSN